MGLDSCRTIVFAIRFRDNSVVAFCQCNEVIAEGFVLDGMEGQTECDYRIKTPHLCRLKNPQF